MPHIKFPWDEYPVYYTRNHWVRQENPGASAALSFEEVRFVEFADALDQVSNEWLPLVVHLVATCKR